MRRALRRPISRVRLLRTLVFLVPVLMISATVQGQQGNIPPSVVNDLRAALDDKAVADWESGGVRHHHEAKYVSATSTAGACTLKLKTIARIIDRGNRVVEKHSDLTVDVLRTTVDTSNFQLTGQYALVSLVGTFTRSIVAVVGTFTYSGPSKGEGMGKPTNSTENLRRVELKFGYKYERPADVAPLNDTQARKFKESFERLKAACTAGPMRQ